MILFPWFTSHYLRKNFNVIQKTFGGKTVSLKIEGYDIGMNLTKEKVNPKITIQSSMDGFHHNPSSTNTYYFPTDDKLKKFNANIDKRIKDLVNAVVVIIIRINTIRSIKIICHVSIIEIPKELKGLV